MFIQMGLTWVMGGEFLVVAPQPPLHPVHFATCETFVAVPSVAACKLKHSLYHLIHSSTTCMQMLYPIRSSVIYPIMLPLMMTNLLFQTDRGKTRLWSLSLFISVHHICKRGAPCNLPPFLPQNQQQLKTVTGKYTFSQTSRKDNSTC